jgi:hypothetical protein
MVFSMRLLARTLYNKMVWQNVKIGIFLKLLELFSLVPMSLNIIGLMQ